MDKPIKEVLIQGKIINVTLDDGFSSVFDFNLFQSKGTDQTNSVMSLGNLRYTYLDQSTLTNIEILQTNGKAKTVASPMLLTANRNQATLDLVEDVSMLKGWTEGTVTTVQGSSSVVTPPSPIYETEKIGTQFEIIPYINSKNEILLKIKIEISTLKPSSQQMLVPDGNGGYEQKTFDGISEMTIETTLATSDGKGIVLGGLISETISKQEEKTPILGDIPLINAFFRDVSEVKSKTETVVILTPYITNLKNSNPNETVDKLKVTIDENRHIFKEKEFADSEKEEKMREKNSEMVTAPTSDEKEQNHEE